jgi:hypothetical protein
MIGVFVAKVTFVAASAMKKGHDRGVGYDAISSKASKGLCPSLIGLQIAKKTVRLARIDKNEKLPMGFGQNVKMWRPNLHQGFTGKSNGLSRM